MERALIMPYGKNWNRKDAGLLALVYRSLSMIGRQFGCLLFANEAQTQPYLPFVVS